MCDQKVVENRFSRCWGESLCGSRTTVSETKHGVNAQHGMRVSCQCFIIEEVQAV